MGLIHSRARKKRDRAEARLLKEQTRQLTAERLEDKPLLAQPTVGALIGEAVRRRRTRSQ